jgi:hypothetical protein
VTWKGAGVNGLDGFHRLLFYGYLLFCPRLVSFAVKSCHRREKNGVVIGYKIPTE